jgi:hypothetical protein
LIEQNNDWQIGNSATVSNLNSAAATAGARTLGASADSALLLTLNPGVYTAQVTAAGVATGESFLEIFEIDAQRAASFAPVAENRWWGNNSHCGLKWALACPEQPPELRRRQL